MSTNFPTSIDSYVTKVDNVDTVSAAHVNNIQDAVTAAETKIGADSSAVATSHDYKLRHLPTQEQDFDIGSYELRAQTLEADVAIGTAPLTIASTTKVSNLNVDQLDGAHASATPTANYIVIADASGFVTTPSSAPTTNYQVANKKYVDDEVAGISSDPSSTIASFLATRNAGTISNGTITYDSENYDTGANFVHTTGIFTAPQTGRYILCFHAHIRGTASTAYWYLDLIAGVTTYTIGTDSNVWSGAGSTNIRYAGINIVVYMTSGQTAYMAFHRNTADCDVIGLAYFSGSLI